MTEKIAVADELLEKFYKRRDELTRRVKQGSVPFGQTMEGLKLLISGRMLRSEDPLLHSRRAITASAEPDEFLSFYELTEELTKKVTGTEGKLDDVMIAKIQDLIEGKVILPIEQPIFASLAEQVVEFCSYTKWFNAERAQKMGLELMDEHSLIELIGGKLTELPYGSFVFYGHKNQKGELDPVITARLAIEYAMSRGIDIEIDESIFEEKSFFAKMTTDQPGFFSRTVSIADWESGLLGSRNWRTPMGVELLQLVCITNPCYLARICEQQNDKTLLFATPLIGYQKSQYSYSFTYCQGGTMFFDCSLAVGLKKGCDFHICFEVIEHRSRDQMKTPHFAQGTSL